MALRFHRSPLTTPTAVPEIRAAGSASTMAHPPNRAGRPRL